MTIFLIGFMGSGKTTLGIELARCMDMPFIDLDEFIEEQCGATINEIFATVGEARFREIEGEALRRVAGDDAVVATGGGTPLRQGNIELMNACGLTIHLTTTPEVITRRLLLPEQRAKRPLLAGKSDDEIAAYVGAELERRAPFYDKAMLHFDSTDIETAEATRATAAALAEVLVDVASHLA